MQASSTRKQSDIIFDQPMKEESASGSEMRRLDFVGMSKTITPHNSIIPTNSNSPNNRSVIRSQQQSRLKQIHEKFSQNEQQSQRRSMMQSNKSMGPTQKENKDKQKEKDNSLYTQQQLQIHKKIIQEMWDYRYWRLVNNAIETKDWIPVFAFIGEFKLKCTELAKMLVHDKFKYKEIDRIDHRYEMKGQGQLGIYFIQGIIIRVAKISKTRKNEFDKRAQKNIHQQYISYNIVNNLVISMLSEIPEFPTLRVPITCLVKYMGYTFLFQGDTMCNGIETLVYGPMNSTFKYRDKMADLLHTIGRNLNLKSFKIVTAAKNVIQIPFCLTVQLHQINIAFRDIGMTNWFASDSPYYPRHQKQNKLFKTQYYLISFSKLWPLFIDSNITKGYGYLRPEAVLAWKKELSNAVFTNIAFEKDEEGELELAQACKNVKQENIKQLATFLDQATFFVVDSVGIEQIMHYYKINIKFLGLVTTTLSLTNNKKVFQVEMVARILKKIFFTNLQGFENKYEMKELIADFLNLVFVQSRQGQKFYLDVVYKQIYEYYDYEMKQYPPSFVGGGLLHAISYHFGIKLKLIDYPFYKQVEEIFSASHIIDISALAKCFDLQTCSLKKACQKVKQKKRQGLFTQCINEFKILAIIARLSSPDGTYSICSAPEAYFYSELAEVYRNIGDEQQTLKYAEMAIKRIPQKHADATKAYNTLVQYYSLKKQSSRYFQFHEKSLANLIYHLDGKHPLSIIVFNTLGYEILNNDPVKCQKIFARSFQICETALGYMHATSGKILLQLADLPLPPEKTINFLLKALNVLENIETDKKKVQNVCRKISQMYAKMGNLTKMIHYARKSGHWQNQIIALQKLNEYKLVLQLCERPTKEINTIPQLKFLIQKSFSSYVRLLDHMSSSNLYKLFVSLVDHLPNQQAACQRIFHKIKNQLSISITIVQFVKTALNNLLIQIPDLLKEPDFFIGPDFLLQYRDKKLANLILSYMDILSIVGPAKSESIFIQFRKTF